MITIEINERTKAGKVILETARILAQKNEGIEITKENSILVARIKRNHNKQILTKTEKADFIEELQNELWIWKGICQGFQKIKK